MGEYVEAIVRVWLARRARKHEQLAFARRCRVLMP